MDVRRSSDGTWVVFHDRVSRRPRHAKGAEEPVPTVRQAISFCRSRRVPVFLDVKESSRERELLALLRRSGWLGNITLLTYAVASLRRWRRLLPAGHPLLWVTDKHEPLSPRRISIARSIPVHGFVAYRRWINSGSVRRVHSAGLQVWVWTARTAAVLRRLVCAEVDGIMSEVWPRRSI